MPLSRPRAQYAPLFNYLTMSCTVFAFFSWGSFVFPGSLRFVLDWQTAICFSDVLTAGVEKGIGCTHRLLELPRVLFSILLCIDSPVSVTFCYIPSVWIPLFHFHWAAFLKDLFIFMCVCILPACMSLYHTCSVPKDTRRGHWVLGNWSSGQWATVWVLGTGPRFSARSSRALNHWGISPAQGLHFRKLKSKSLDGWCWPSL